MHCRLFIHSSLKQLVTTTVTTMVMANAVSGCSFIVITIERPQALLVHSFHKYVGESSIFADAPSRHSFIMIGTKRQHVLQVHRLVIPLASQANSYGGP